MSCVSKAMRRKIRLPSDTVGRWSLVLLLISRISLTLMTKKYR
jgi:hypothetical protein